MGQTVDCGNVVQQSGNYVTCSEGTRTCGTGGWGECVGQFTTTKQIPNGGGLQLQGLNASTPCVNDPCDPECNTFIDNPVGLDAGVDSGITINEAGVTLSGTPVSLSVCTSLQITPNTDPAKDLTVTTMAPSPNTVQYTAAILPPSCYAGTPTFLWTINQYSIAQINSSGLLTLAVPIAGPITVSAYAGQLTASVVCNVTVNVVDTSNAPTGYTNAQFPTTTGATDNISVLYPYPATVFPLGLPSPLIQWRNNNATAGTGPKYLGCYNDSATRDLPYNAYSSSSNTVELCVATCKAAGYAYAGAQYGSQCFCGNSYGGQGTSTNCNMACSGNGAETCGGSYANSVYATAPVTAPPTTASAVKVTLRYPPTSPIFSWAEIVPELETAPTPTLPGQPRATIPQSVWQDFQQTVVHNSPSGGDAVFAIQRYVNGTLMGEVPTTIHFANGQLKGTVFYNSYGTNLVQNFGNTLGGQPFGAATLQVPVNGTTPTVVVGYNDPTLSGAGCRVCHNANAQGTTLLSNSYLTDGNTGGGSEATTFTYNATLATPALIQGSQALVGSYGSNVFTFAALSPDGTYLFNSAGPASSGAASGLYTAAGVGISSNVPGSLYAATPVFSPDAAHVAFNFNGGNAKPLANSSADGRSLAMMDFAPPATFSNFRTLSTPPSSALYSVWPTFLPPGQNGIVFQNSITSNGRDWAATRSTCDGTATCNNVGATGELWWVSTGTTPSATRLTNLNGGAYMPRGNLVGTFGVQNNSSTVSTTSNQIGLVVPGAQLNFASQSGTYYIVSSVSSNQIILTSNYGGSSNGATTAVQNYHGTSSNDGSFYEEVYNYEPAALPVTVGGYSWVAFTSRRMYGNVATINPYWSDPRFQNLTAEPTTKKIWVAAISGSPTPGTDPSYPAFYLPGQELLAGNARAYFTLAACEPPGPISAATLCTSALDCCGGTASPPTSVCQLDPPPLANPPTSHCVATTTATCVANGAACTSDAQCCNFASGARCGSGTCLPPPPIDVYGSAPFTTTYEASCPVGTYPAWRFYYWESITPNGTSINFTAQTSIDGVNWGTAVAIGSAVPPPNVTPTWTSGPLTVDQALRASNQVSQLYLKVIAMLNPDTTKTYAPVLTNWQLTYDCVPSE
ncbi:MAG: WSC domain-containing protein [Polyangiaceae bacterium]